MSNVTPNFGFVIPEVPGANPNEAFDWLEFIRNNFLKIDNLTGGLGVMNAAVYTDGDGYINLVALKAAAILRGYDTLLIYFPAGNYTISDANPMTFGVTDSWRGVALLGEIGAIITVVDVQSITDYIIRFENIETAIVKGLTFVGSGDTTDVDLDVISIGAGVGEVIIQKNLIENVDSGIWVEGSGALPRRVSIVDNTIRNPQYLGIFVDNNSQPGYIEIARNTISYDATMDAEYDPGFGQAMIRTNHTIGAIIRDNNISIVDAAFGWKAGLYIEYSDRCVISNNVVIGGEFGIYVEFSSYALISGNNVDNTGWYQPGLSHVPIGVSGVINGVISHPTVVNNIAVNVVFADCRYITCITCIGNSGNVTIDNWSYIDTCSVFAGNKNIIDNSTGLSQASIKDRTRFFSPGAMVPVAPAVLGIDDKNYPVIDVPDDAAGYAYFMVDFFEFANDLAGVNAINVETWLSGKTAGIGNTEIQVSYAFIPRTLTGVTGDKVAFTALTAQVVDGTTNTLANKIRYMLSVIPHTAADDGKPILIIKVGRTHAAADTFNSNIYVHGVRVLWVSNGWA